MSTPDPLRAIPSSEHWLLRSARRVAGDGFDTRRPSELPTDPSEAWRVVAAAAGIGEDALAVAVGALLDVPVASLAEVDPRAVKLLPERVARRYCVVPLMVTDRYMQVATADPTHVQALMDLEFAVGREVRFSVAPPEQIRRQLDGLYSPEAAIASVAHGFGPGEAAIVLEEDLAPDVTVGALEDPTGAVRRLAATLLRDAVVQGASDIHLTLNGAEGVVRYRIDGIMRPVLTMPAAVFVRVVSRLKVIGALDVADHRRPQDGRSRVIVDGAPVDLRLSTLPVEGGSERLVIRILLHETIASLDTLDLVDPERQQLLTLMGVSDGMVVMTGPTGSGKTTTLHAALRHRMSPEVTIMTVENPVEYRIAGISQVQVEPKAGLTFASALRAMLRQDPDIVLVGEIRDTETAQTAAQAAMTGHLVLTTVHADDAPGALLRMRDLGLELDTLAESFRGAAAQRLLRRLCLACKAPPDLEALTPVQLSFREITGQLPPRHATGCAKCGFTGYRGRFPIHQVFIMSDSLRHVVQSGADTETVRAAARAQGMRSLGESALSRIMLGMTSVEEAVRVLGSRFWEEIGGQRVAANRRPSAEPVIELDEAVQEAALAARAIANLSAPTRVLTFSSDPGMLAQLRTACAAIGVEAVGAMTVAEAARIGHETLGIRMMIGYLGVAPGKREEEVIEVLVDLRRSLGDLLLPVLLVLPEGNAFLPPLLHAAGVDDYLTTPVETEVVTKRIRAALRRSVEQRALIEESHG